MWKYGKCLENQSFQKINIVLQISPQRKLGSLWNYYQQKQETKFFCAQNLFLGQAFYRTKDNFSLKIFGAQNLFWTQIIFGPNIFSDRKFFQTKTFFWTQNELQWKAIFGGRKQRFWTWGSLNCQGQRFSFNWSLTLMTKSCFN